jgi:hypothetical protein
MCSLRMPSPCGSPSVCHIAPRSAPGCSLETLNQGSSWLRPWLMLRRTAAALRRQGSRRSAPSASPLRLADPLPAIGGCPDRRRGVCQRPAAAASHRCCPDARAAVPSSMDGGIGQSKRMASRSPADEGSPVMHAHAHAHEGTLGAPQTALQRDTSLSRASGCCAPAGG